ncbi:flavin reductase family protein [Streptomyces sp. NPDC055078]
MSPAPSTGTVAQSPEFKGEFVAALSRFAASVSVITYYADGERACGMTASSVSSLSVEPMSLLVCINKFTRTHTEIARRRRFGINFLAEDQRSISNQCARPGGDKTLDANWLLPSEDGRAPFIDGAVASFDLDVSAMHEAFTHSVVVGTVRGMRLGEQHRPLVYCDRSYQRMEEPDDTALNRLWERMLFGSMA